MDQKILDALKTINDKLGGTNDPNENWGSLLQEIAQNVGSGGGGFIVETEYVMDIGEYHHEGFMTELTAEEITTAFTAGAQVVFHFPAIEGDEGEFREDSWANLAGIGAGVNPNYFPFTLGVSPNWQSEIRVVNGKIFFQRYID